MMTAEQKKALEQLENPMKSVGLSPIQTLTMGLSYFKGGYYEELTEQDFEKVVKAFVEKYFK